MKEFAVGVNEFLAFRRYGILPDMGWISSKISRDKAETEYQVFNKEQVIESGFNREVKKMISESTSFAI